ncbi:MAG: riboflavin synthase subunit alpha [Planctomycetes bacterium RBG_16_43_13]|nr:MAG: riboflavin synthase subunit alpha [Planctomycetes bacterium RBG_16_43_13]
MFTGIIEHSGRVTAISRTDKGACLTLYIKGIRIHKGDSVAVNGVCLTTISAKNGGYSFDVVSETLSRTDIGKFTVGSIVNIELPMTTNSRFGGHFVQGHIDGTGKIQGRETVGEAILMWIKVEPPIADILVEKGSVAVDGVSLTVVDVTNDAFSVALIPYTLEKTTLGRKSIGDTVNIETDIIGKYIKKYLKEGRKQGNVTKKFLEEAGFV